MGNDHEIEFPEIPKGKVLMLFDGVCNLCNNRVDYILRIDKRERFVFASLQSDFGQRLLSALEYDREDFNSFIIVKRGKVYKKSRAVLEVLIELEFPWPLLYVFVIVPFFIRDIPYNIVANNRLKWFGKRDTCRVPTEAEKARFLG